ncbi:MAG: 4Fe-4S cluster-binding domain-containing protein [Lachnospirales bacterium]
MNDDMDELEDLKLNYWENKVNSEVLHLSIMTTLKCNFKCTYCFEEPKNIELNEQVENKILSFIKKNIKIYKSIHIDWYGGEPLINIKSIECLSEKIIEICNENGVQYWATITTNGYDYSIIKTNGKTL